MKSPFKDGIGTKVISFKDLDDSVKGKLGLSGEGFLIRKFGILPLTNCRQVSEENGDGSGDIVSVISAETVDREGDVILASGWRLANYRKNPTVLFAHDYRQLPIGKGRVRVNRDNKTLLASTAYLDHEFARDVRAADVKKVLGSSVGFLPVDYEIRTEEGDEKNQQGVARRLGTLFKRQELLEYSKVPIPANPDCVTLGMKALGGDGVAAEELRREVRNLAKNKKTFLIGLKPESQKKESDPIKPKEAPRILFDESGDQEPDPLAVSVAQLADDVAEVLSETVELKKILTDISESLNSKSFNGPGSHPYQPEILEPTAGARQETVDLRRASGRIAQVARRLKRNRREVKRNASKSRIVGNR